MDQPKKVLLVGPLLPPIHGQSLAFTRFAEHLSDDQKIIINTNQSAKRTIGKVFGTLKLFLLISYKALFSRYDVVYFTCSRSILGSLKDVLLVWLTKKNAKLINHLHGSDFYDFLHDSPPLYRSLLFRTYRRVDVSIVLLENMKGLFKDFEHMKLELVPNFYDQELDQKIVEKSEQTIQFVYLSNIMSTKGILVLLEAFKVLSQTHPHIHLKIAGGYIADEELSAEDVKKQFLDVIDNHERITYLGKVYGKDKIELLQSSDIFILPSYYKSEAFPISIIEAMACGNAIVTTDYKYLPEVVKEANGLLVEPKSVQSLIKGIEQLISNPQLLKKIQQNNIKEARETYSIQQHLSKLDKIVF